MKADSKKVVLAALIGNFLITVSKFIVSVVSGSTAMLAEAIHSLADTGNQVLLLIGFQLSKKAPDELHPFGYGKERYFWALMVGVSMFVIGSVISFYEGISKILHPHPIENIGWIYFVLALSFLFESYPFLIAYQELRRSSLKTGIIHAIHQSKRPAVVVVFLEDTAALLGIIIAFTGVLVTHLTGNMVLDGVASVCIGVLLAFVAFTITYEIRHLLLGEGVSKEDYMKIKMTTERTPGVTGITKIMSMYLGPDDILININVIFNNELSSNQITKAIDLIEANIRQEIPAARIITVEAVRDKREENRLEI